VVLAPEIAVSRWFNTNEPVTLAGLRTRRRFKHPTDGARKSGQAQMQRRESEVAPRG
jgi:hypothetical protein